VSDRKITNPLQHTAAITDIAVLTTVVDVLEGFRRTGATTAAARSALRDAANSLDAERRDLQHAVWTYEDELATEVLATALAGTDETDWTGTEDYDAMTRKGLDEVPTVDCGPVHTVGGKTSVEGWPYGTTHDADCPACVASGSSFTASPRSETYWAS
jgi:hypothetical protein